MVPGMTNDTQSPGAPPRLEHSRWGSAWRIGCALWLMAGDAGANEPVDFAREIRPLLNQHCTSCHGGVKRAGGVSFLSREGALVEAKSGRRVIVPGHDAESELIRRVISTDEDERMPPPDHGPALPAGDVAKLREWIRHGAPWTKHWAYEKPVRPAVPAVRQADWPKQGLDRFVLARLESENLKPSPPADRLVWLRRAAFDLTGLPPTEEAAHAFLADKSTDAFERAADRLLALPSFGERWATPWLDLARYADTMGYERDFNRAIWPWRDWVIRALNDDLSYDEFVARQLAGDLRPNASEDDRLATAFHRNTQTNTEDGTDDEEFRVAAVVDRVATTWEGLLGTSFRCVQCHSHPYDPFTHQEYYRFSALLNTSRDHDAREDFPVLRVAARETDRAYLAGLEGWLRNLRHELHGEGMALAKRTAWQPLRGTAAKSTGQTLLTLRNAPEDGRPELIASGTLTTNSVYTVDFALPEGGPLTALRLEALPENEAKALAFPELGFVLSWLRLQVPDPTNSTNWIDRPLAAAYDEDPDAFFPAEASLDKNREGWCAYPRFHRRRAAVFVPAGPLDLASGGAFRLVMAHDVQSSGLTAQVIRRARFAFSREAGWTSLAQAQTSRWTQVQTLRKQCDEIPNVLVPVMDEQPASQRRETRMFHRGNWLDKGELAAPGVPALLGETTVRDRAELARWMTSPEHPLFARVAVNRFWEQLFGRGIVESSEEFGSTGQEPSHPALLDWLAVRFAGELEFRPKRLLREIVLSATYRQDARVAPELLERDPRNRLLARGPRQRLSAEMVRDQALAVSGLLSPKMGGPPAMPLQPDGIWRTVYNGGRWVTPDGEDAHRRTLYTFVRRTSGYPGLATFDAPSREFCTVRRLPTNTPLQALATMNDPVYLETAAALAQRMAEAGRSTEARIERGWRLAVGRAVRREELKPLLELHRDALKKLSSEPRAAAALANTPELGALTVVANALLNLDAVLTR